MFLAIAALFAAVIYFGLRFRKRSMAQNLELHAFEVWKPFEASGWNFEDLLFSVAQDFSSTQFGYIVKNCRDQQIARIIFHAAALRGWIWVQMDGANFEADALLRMRQEVVFHPAENESQILCRFTRTGGNQRFEAPEVGVLESQRPNRLTLAPRFEFTLNGQAAGVAQHIGGAVDRGRALVLPGNIPLPVRLFVLAMQAERS
jgi:hypothetical protein